MKNVAGKRVLVTGGARGIGLCTAEAFALAGSELVLTDIDEDALDKAETLLSGHGSPVHTRVVDVADSEQVYALARWVIEELGGLDVLINNAGLGHHGELADTTLETWKKLLSVNLMGPLNHISAFLPHFKQRRAGHIVNVSSGQAFFRLPTWGAYASVKAALGVFSEILQFELRKYGIRVTTVYPFMVDTGFYDDIEGETMVGRLAMKLVPYYSMSPERVGQIILKAVRKGTKVEMVSVLNDVANYVKLVPFANDVISSTSNFFLASDADRAA
ncbi:MAG: SDR family oxidoreductase [bacterium]